MRVSIEGSSDGKAKRLHLAPIDDGISLQAPRSGGPKNSWPSGQELPRSRRHLTFCYEAGPTGYWLYRLIRSLGDPMAEIGHEHASRLLRGHGASNRITGQHRCITVNRGHECLVVAPSLTPNNQVKTNRRDAVNLAKLLRADEQLTAVWVPDGRHEAMRDFSRIRQAAKKDQQGKRQRSRH
jgi:transposase